MSSKRRLRRKGCVGKVQHQTLEEAICACKSLGKQRGEKGLRPYRCQFCSTQAHPRYHIGHSDEWRYAA